ncbi:ectonucleoside triphosphate diphosphohydrolase 2-like isoform X2 [Myripristis murdjan]|uniref:ectonucleoside triphosphate diphosphohydrolase 2-like isoform X2 n=1 Tax=Myripristis murdjan TaxID=586833 RepID=UPI0011763C76|nr:ectonucleoside triphosphate diphosphohydrolase 2-like isoform X2 [Myripristis murdjan]
MALRFYHLIPPVLLLILAIVGILLVVLPAEEMKAPPESMYGIVLDAGSSHTSMYIYKWPADKQNGTGIVTQHSECDVKGGGISSYAGNRSGAAQSLEPCLKQAMKDIPKSKHHLTPVYLGATAGMRLLSETDPTEAQQILKEVGDKLRSYPFSFREATILNGQQEGAYGWVTVNYLQENFIKYGYVGHWISPDRATVGALDLGGASTQITFETSDKLENKDNTMELKLYGRKYHLYTQSFLCYGQDQFLRRLLAHLIRTQGTRGKVFHPCYPAQFSDTIKLGENVFDSPCTDKYKPASFDPQQSVTVEGVGDYQHCLGNVSALFSFKNCSFSKCSFDGVYQPDVRGSFMAFSAFFFTHDFLKQATGLPVMSPSQMEKATQIVCNMTIAEMQTKVQSKPKYLKNYCAVSSFMKVLLVDGYRFDEHSFHRISFEKKEAHL